MKAVLIFGLLYVSSTVFASVSHAGVIKHVETNKMFCTGDIEFTISVGHGYSTTLRFKHAAATNTQTPLVLFTSQNGLELVLNDFAQGSHGYSVSSKLILTGDDLKEVALENADYKSVVLTGTWTDVESGLVFWSTTSRIHKITCSGRLRVLPEQP